MQFSDRNTEIQAAILAALMHHKPDYRRPVTLDKSASIIANFVIDKLDAMALSEADSRADR